MTRTVGLTGLLLLLFFFPSCIVERPPYATIEQVLSLKPGMTKEEVSKVLDIPPYDLKRMTDTGSVVLIYKYRVTNRRTFPFFVKPRNGLKTTGKYVDLFVTYDKSGRSTKIESCSECEQTVEKKLVTVDRILALLTVVAPSILIYFGILKQ
jgi:hypothetical protein